LSKLKFLLDVNVLFALAEPTHVHHRTVMRWFNTPSLDWGLCAFSEAGFLRVATNPKSGSYTVKDAAEVLKGLAAHPGYRYWPVTAGWLTLAAPFRERVFGHQQITDAFLLGLAVKEHGVLVTLDKAFKFLAGERYSKHLLVLV
jgi:toxin-antitoxin system PIN domain toxin